MLFIAAKLHFSNFVTKKNHKKVHLHQIASTASIQLTEINKSKI